MQLGAARRQLSSACLLHPEPSLHAGADCLGIGTKLIHPPWDCQGGDGEGTRGAQLWCATVQAGVSPTVAMEPRWWYLKGSDFAAMVGLAARWLSTFARYLPCCSATCSGQAPSRCQKLHRGGVVGMPAWLHMACMPTCNRRRQDELHACSKCSISWMTHMQLSERACMMMMVRHCCTV